ERLDDPVGHGRQHTAVQYLEPASRPPDDVAAGTAGIDVRPQLAGAALHALVRLEQEMFAATAGGVRARQRQPMAIILEPRLGIFVLQVEVDHHELRAGRHADQGVRGVRPPPMYNVGVRGRVLEPVRRQRALGLGVAGEDRATAARSLEGFGPRHGRSSPCCSQAISVSSSLVYSNSAGDIAPWSYRALIHSNWAWSSGSRLFLLRRGLDFVTFESIRAPPQG